MTTAILRAKRALLATGAAAAFIMLASTANAACTDGDDCAGSSVAFYDEDGDDEDEGDDGRDFVYDENQGSLLVDQSDCEPGKYWMMYTDMADDVMMPCR